MTSEEQPVESAQAHEQAARTNLTDSIAPVAAQDRIAGLDVVRGLALLGILLMNVPTFAYTFVATYNPTIQGGATGVNYWTYAILAVLVDGKMRALFSLMFGAGVYLMTSRPIANAADLHYRRMLWLALFGLVHAYLIWYGDILYPYALCGLVLFPLRVLRPRTLFLVASVMIVLMSAGGVFEARQSSEAKTKAEEAERLVKEGKKLTEEQEEARKNWKERLKNWAPDAEELKKDTDAYRGSYTAALKRRAQQVVGWHSSPLYGPGLWDMFSMMLFGIGLMKLGFFSAGWSHARYGKLAAAGYLIGVPLISAAVWLLTRSNFDILMTGWAMSLYQPARVLIALAHASVVMLIIKAGLLQALTSRLAAVGQMAFTNYLLQSVICALLFYGYGFGLYGKLERHQLLYIVAAIWAFQLVASPIWLRHFRFGPLEWCWRSLTYWKRPPMRIGLNAAE